MWTFSIYLEAVAIIPQLVLLSKGESADDEIVYYIFAFGTYRALYIFNWIYRYLNEQFYDPIAVVSGGVHVALIMIFSFVFFASENYWIRPSAVGQFFQKAAPTLQRPFDLKPQDLKHPNLSSIFVVAPTSNYSRLPSEEKSREAKSDHFHF